ncbi:hypothetical protein [Streptomyces sp. CBMA123]|uniref:hypothetical protein n=1 Tax=Streptomyces sp. CBMA123 TaxID=1896313 RepID=UPI001661AB62|nr:hypothetical protein [Streptomyces sp. CBMA123]MBD0690272.1 hypothetical protein [Streptomyces sp. CBMA123]
MTPAAPKRTTAPKPAPCKPCKGTGQITETVYAGRGARRHWIADQEATCLDCLGAGTTPA